MKRLKEWLDSKSIFNGLKKIGSFLTRHAVSFIWLFATTIIVISQFNAGNIPAAWFILMLGVYQIKVIATDEISIKLIEKLRTEIKVLQDGKTGIQTRTRTKS